MLDAVAPSLLERLPKAPPPHMILTPPQLALASTSIGPVAPTWRAFGFKSSCKVVPFTGDNPASMCGVVILPAPCA